MKKKSSCKSQQKHEWSNYFDKKFILIEVKVSIVATDVSTDVLQMLLQQQNMNGEIVLTKSLFFIAEYVSIVTTDIMGRKFTVFHSIHTTSKFIRKNSQLW